MPLSNVVSKTHSTALKTPLGSVLLLKSPLFSICILKHNRSSSYLCVCRIDHFSKQLLHKTVPLFPKQHLLFWQVSLHLPVASKLHVHIRGNVVSHKPPPNPLPLLAEHPCSIPVQGRATSNVLNGGCFFPPFLCPPPFLLRCLCSHWTHTIMILRKAQCSGRKAEEPLCISFINHNTFHILIILI